MQRKEIKRKKPIKKKKRQPIKKVKKKAPAVVIQRKNTRQQYEYVRDRVALLLLIGIIGYVGYLYWENNAIPAKTKTKPEPKTDPEPGPDPKPEPGPEPDPEPTQKPKKEKKPYVYGDTIWWGPLTPSMWGFIVAAIIMYGAMYKPEESKIIYGHTLGFMGELFNNAKLKHTGIL